MLSEDKDIFRGITLFERLMSHDNLDIDLVNDNVYTKVGIFCPFIIKILSKNQILTSIKDHNYVVNLRKMMLYNPN